MVQARGIHLSLPWPLSGLLPQVAALIARYVGGGGELDKAALDTLATFRPAYLCVSPPRAAGPVQPQRALVSPGSVRGRSAEL